MTSAIRKRRKKYRNTTKIWEANARAVYELGQFAILTSMRDTCTGGARKSWVVLSLSIFLVVIPLWAQTPSPADLVRQTVTNEINSNNGGTKFVFHDKKNTPHGSQTKLVVETNEATAGMLIAINDRPLTVDQRQSEENRLDALVNNPEELKKKQKAEKEDSRRTERIVRAFPDAFLFEHDGTEPSKPGVGSPGDELVRLKFRPNPSYSPPSHTEQVLTGMQGILLIDTQKHRIAKIDGTLFKEVGFGWGILGHLDKGGHFLVEQSCVTESDWEVTRMSLAFTGKELFFKTINFSQDETLSDFHPAPKDMTFAQAVDFLKKQTGQIAENGLAKSDQASSSR